MVEVTLLGVDHTASATVESDVHTFVDTLMRYGLDERTEVQIGLTGYVRAISTERASGRQFHAKGLGDGYLAVRRSVSGLSGEWGGIAAIEAYVTLPTGDDSVSAGTWGAGVVMPIDLPSSGPFDLSLTPEIGAAPNASGAGRHLVYGAVLGAFTELAPDWGGGLEISAVQDDEPDGPEFGSKLAGTLAWQASERLQLNAELDVVVAGRGPRTIAMMGFALRL